MGKKKEKRLKIKVLPIIIFFLIIILITTMIYFLTLIPISNIYIKGNNYLSDQTIIEDAKIENYPSFIKTSKATIKKRLLKNPYIKGVKVTKKLMGIINITIEENKVLFRKDETKMIVLENGKELDDENQFIVPILLNYIPDTKYDTFVKKMNEVDENIKQQISEIRYYPNQQDEDRFLLYMNDGNEVYVTISKLELLNKYIEIIQKVNIFNKIYYSII